MLLCISKRARDNKNGEKIKPDRATYFWMETRDN